MYTYNVGDEIKPQFNLSGRLWLGDDKPEKGTVQSQVFDLWFLTIPLTVE